MLFLLGVVWIPTIKHPRRKRSLTETGSLGNHEGLNAASVSQLPKRQAKNLTKQCKGLDIVTKP
jgi:hypothetical protein